MVFVFAPGGSGPLPKAVAVAFVLAAPLFAYLAYQAAFVPPVPRVLSCARARDATIACEPGALRGPRAVLERQSGKNAKDCFTLAGDGRWQCSSTDGAAAAAVTRVNALVVGESAAVDLTETKSKAAAPVFLVFALAMFAVGIQRLRR